MKRTAFITKMNGEIVKGQFTKAEWKSVKTDKEGNTYEKVSNGVVRFVKYANIKGVQVKGQSNPNEFNAIESEFLYYNVNTNKEYVQMATTHIKPHCKYYKNGVEIAKQDYEMANPSHKSNGAKSVVFRVLLDNLISAGNH